MTDRRIIAVVGATGAQGGGLARAILADPEQRFAVRALTRNASSSNARALARLGAEVVEADLDDLASLERAFRGAHGVFCVTFFWEHHSPLIEQRQAQNLAHAASRARVRHAIWSTLEDTRRWYSLADTRMPTLMGAYKVPHSDAKGAMNGVFTELGVPTTFLLTSFYWENLIHFGMGPQRSAEGDLVFVLPMADKKLPGIAAEDIGKCALGIYRRPQDCIGQTIGIAGEHLSGAEMAAAMSAALGEPVRHEDIAPADYRRLGFPGAEELGNMFQFKQEYNADLRAARSVVRSRTLNPELQRFEAWLARHAHRLPITPRRERNRVTGAS